MKPKPLDLRDKTPLGTIDLPLSKSISNRALILQSLYPTIHIPQFSDSDDAVVLKNALTSSEQIIDLGAAGTAMRFATSWFAAKEGCEVLLTGSNRMLKRPIKPLVEALRTLGASIQYEGAEGFPPLRIKGKKIRGGRVTLDASLSSQFATSLLLVASKFENGLNLSFDGEIVSKPYLSMTIKMMKDIGLSVAENQDGIMVDYALELPKKEFGIEGDWSSAAYWFGFVALSEDGEIQLNGLKRESLQGDSRIVEIFRELGVQSTFNKKGVLIRKVSTQKPRALIINLNDTPDLGQPLSVVCAALGIGVDFRGLSTLKIKETDRLQALKKELAKAGCEVVVDSNSLKFKPCLIKESKQSFDAYDDHRMAMSFALLATRMAIVIKNPKVVSKSYPNFWKDIDSSFKK